MQYIPPRDSGNNIIGKTKTSTIEYIETVYNETANIAVNTNGCTCHNDEDDRWDWLISSWSSMTFKERMTLFMPYYHYMTLRDYKREDFDKAINNEIVDMTYELCRDFESMNFELPSQDTPTIIMKFKPVDPNKVPDGKIKSDIIFWGKCNGFINTTGSCSCNHHK